LPCWSCNTFYTKGKHEFRDDSPNSEGAGEGLTLDGVRECCATGEKASFKAEEAAENLGYSHGIGEKGPSAAKAGHSCCACGTTEVEPFQSE
jgi:hypothetical protein